MKIEIPTTKEVDVAFVRICVAVRYGEEDIPDDFCGRVGDTWNIVVDANTGQIQDWTGGAFDMYMKVCDEGCYYLIDTDGNAIAGIENDYVPHGVVPGKYGDYIQLDINESGVITNWPKKLDVKEFLK